MLEMMAEGNLAEADFGKKKLEGDSDEIEIKIGPTMTLQ